MAESNHRTPRIYDTISHLEDTLGFRIHSFRLLRFWVYATVSAYLSISESQDVAKKSAQRRMDLTWRYTSDLQRS